MSRRTGETEMNGRRWESLPEGVWIEILSHLDVATVIEKKRVDRAWRALGDAAIDGKRMRKDALKTTFELRCVIEVYMGLHFTLESKEWDPPDSAIQERYTTIDREDAEELASVHGWPIGKWDVSNITDFSNIFCGIEDFNEDISNWNTGKATTMRGMFMDATKFNQDLSKWDVSKVTCMESMFHNAKSFNKDVSRWSMSGITNTVSMFEGAKSFNQNITKWDMSNVKYMQRMFFDATSFCHNVSLAWNLESVIHDEDLFRNALSHNFFFPCEERNRKKRKNSTQRGKQGEEIAGDGIPNVSTAMNRCLEEP
jgi:surface protein